MIPREPNPVAGNSAAAGRQSSLVSSAGAGTDCGGRLQPAGYR